MFSEPSDAPTRVPRNWLPAAVLLGGLAITVALFIGSMRLNAIEQRAALSRLAESISHALSGRVQSYLDTLPGLRMFGVLSKSPTDAEFLRYIDAISLHRRFPGLVVTFFGNRVRAGDEAGFTEAVTHDQSVQAEGHPGFHIVPEGQRPDYMVLRHLYPADPPAFGYDLFDPGQSYRAAVEEAIVTGGYVATGPIRLARDRFKRDSPELATIVIRAAIYAGGVTPDTEAARKQAASGIVGISFRTIEFVRSVLPPDESGRLHVRIVDTRAAAEGKSGLVYDSAREADKTAPAAAATETGAPFKIEIANRTWEGSIAEVRPGLLPDADSTSWTLLTLGAALSISLSLLTRALVRSNLLAAQQVRVATAALVDEKANLEQSERRYRMLFDNSLDAVLRTRPGGEIMAANPAACALFGYSEVELQQLGRGSVVDVSDERLETLLSARSADGRARGMLRMIKSDGSSFEAELASNTYTEDDGTLVASVFVRDVTERLALEVRLRDAQKLESIGTLAGGVAHDFNNVLVAILGNVALARDDLAASHPTQAMLARIQQAAVRARSLVNQILTFSRREPPARVVQPLGPIVREALDLLRATLPATVHLTAEIAAEPALALVDSAQVHQVLMNLCTNAWQSLAGGCGHVEVQLQRVELSSAEATALGVYAGPHLRLRVADDGAGMDAATRKRAFEPFFTTKSRGQGTGLGLAVVHGIVTSSAGCIDIQSTPGHGSRVDVYLPAADSTLPIDAGTATAASPAPGRGERVLYVDDDDVVAITIQALLERGGYRATTLGDGQTALAEITQDPSRFDLVITDYNMPGMSGLTMAEALRRVAPRLPVIMTSGYVTEELREHARSAGVRRVVPKEHSTETLVEIAAQVLRDRRQGA